MILGLRIRVIVTVQNEEKTGHQVTKSQRFTKKILVSLWQESGHLRVILHLDFDACHFDWRECRALENKELATQGGCRWNIWLDLSEVQNDRKIADMPIWPAVN